MAEVTETPETPETPEAAPTPDTPPAAPETPPETPEAVSISKAELDALRRSNSEAQRALRAAEAATKAAAEKRAEEEGRYRELAETRAQELAEERAAAARATTEARITRLASRMKFVDPSDVIGRISSDEAVDDATAEAALERIAKASPHLVTKDPPATPEIGRVMDPAVDPATDGPKPPPGKAPLRTMADVEALSQQEMIDRMDEVDVVLAQQ